MTVATVYSDQSVVVRFLDQTPESKKLLSASEVQVFANVYDLLHIINL